MTRGVPAERAGAGENAGKWLNRRWILLIAGLLVIAALSGALSRRLIPPRADLAAAGFDAGKLADYRCTPEYERRLKTVVVSLARRDTTLKLQHSILAALPEYTKIIMLLPASNAELIQRQLDDKPYRGRVQFVTYRAASLNNSKLWILFRDKDKLVEINVGASGGASYGGNTWAQDMFEVMRDSRGRAVLLRSCMHKYLSTAGANSDMRITPDNAYIERLSTAGVEIQTLPLAFMGGNIFVDEIDGRRLALCGGDILRTTRTVSRAVSDSCLSNVEITATLKGALNVDKVVMVGQARLQPSQMYHLDQALILLGSKTAAVAKIVGRRPTEPEQIEEIQQAEQFLVELRSTLASLGYRVADIETSVQNVLRCQHYVNAIPYVDAESGQKTLLMPVYRSARTDLDKELIDGNTAVFESFGYEVVHVQTSADELRGGIHCLINVLE